ncbi:MAG: right-handed parallel beta-helix repeat-containing protein, partial [Planctomycetota bacterium]
QADTPTNGVEYWVIDGFESTSAANYGFEIDYATNLTIKNCISHANTAACFFIEHSDYVLIENNTAYSAGAGSGFVVGESGDYLTLRGNTSYGNPSNGILVINATGDDQIASGYLIEKNTLYGNTNGINADGLETSEIKNNLVYDNTARGLYLNGFNALISSRNNLVLNNTVVVPSTGAYVVFIVRFTGGIPEATGNKLYNNILYHYGTSTDDYTICIDTAAETDFESDYNVVMEYFGLDDGAQTLTFAQWQARGYDLNSIQAADTDLFTDPASDDYTLKSTSPAKDAGTTRAEVTDDIVGTARPQGSAYDIGCYEYVEGIPDLVITTSSLADGTVGAD